MKRYFWASMIGFYILAIPTATVIAITKTEAWWPWIPFGLAMACATNMIVCWVTTTIHLVNKKEA